MNRNFGKLDAANAITYAPNVLRDGDTVICSPNATDYAAQNWLPIISEMPTKVGVYYTSTERGEVKDGAIHRIYEEHQIVAPVVVHRYSKLKLITAAKAAGKWDALKAWIASAGYEDEWAACMYLSDDYAGFDQIKAAIVSAGVATADEIDAILAAAEDETLQAEV